jgi:hypothetical protein
MRYRYIYLLICAALFACAGIYNSDAGLDPKKLGKKIEKEAKRAADKGEKLLDDITGKSEKALDKAKEEARQAAEKLEQNYGSAKQKLKELGEKVDKKQRELVDQVSEKAEQAIQRVYELQKEQAENVKELAVEGYKKQKEILNDASDKISDFAEKTKATIDLTLKYGKSWPERLPPVTPREFDEIDWNFSISKDVIRDIFRQILATEPKIILSKESPENNYLIVRECRFDTDPEWNTVILTFTNVDSRIEIFDGFFPANAQINELILELFPLLIKKENEWHLKIFAQVRYLEVDDFPEWSERIIAGLANDNMKQPVVDQNVDHYLVNLKKFRLLDKEVSLATNVDRAAILVREKEISLIGTSAGEE